MFLGEVVSDELWPRLEPLCVTRPVLVRLASLADLGVPAEGRGELPGARTSYLDALAGVLEHNPLPSRGGLRRSPSRSCSPRTMTPFGWCCSSTL